jgi:hypothetical protein
MWLGWGKQDMQTKFWWKYLDRCPYLRPRRRKDNNKMDLREIRCEDLVGFNWLGFVFTGELVY